MGSIIDRALDIINDHLKDQTSSFQVASPLAAGKTMARGGHVLEDDYPTHYLPEVGRQVMKAGGMPDPVGGALSTARAIPEEPLSIPPTNPAALTGRGFEGRVQSPKLAETFERENAPGVIVSPRPGKGGGPRVLPERGVPYEQPEYEGYGAHGETPTSDIEFSPSTPALAGTALPPPVQHPLQNEPRLQKVTENTQRIIKSPGFRKLVEDHVGLKGPLQITPTHGTWKGEAEPSFILSHPDMQQEHAEKLAHLLGFGFQQDAVVRSEHNPNMADGTLAALIGHGRKLNAKDIDGLTEAAKKEGLDYTITKDGKAAKFLHFGSDEEYPDFLDKVGRIADLNRFKERYNARTQGSLINAQNYFSGIFGKDSGGEGVQDGTTRSSDLFGRIVDHVLAPYAKAVAGEGYRLSPERLAETFGLTQDEQDKVRTSLYPNAKGDRTTVPLMTGEETLDVRPTGARGNDTVNDVLYALQNRAAEKGQIDPGDFSDQAKKRIASDIADEVKYHVDNSEKSAVGWYDEALKKAKDIYHQVFPELKTDKDKEMLFDAILGITSQGNDVHSNSVFAARMYDKLRNEGKSIPDAVKDLSGGFGAQTKAIEGNLMKLHHLLDQNGYDRMRDLFNQKKTVSEWNKILRTDPKLAVPGQDTLEMQGSGNQKVTGWMVFGPKIGSFINNLHGDYSTLTADLWFSRTWNRLLGHNFIHAPLAEQKQYQDFKDAIKAEFLHHNGLPHEQYAGKTKLGQYQRDKAGNIVPWKFGNDMQDMSHDDFENLVNNPEKMQELATNLYEQYKGGGFKDKSDARRRAKNWMENRDLPVAAPRGDKERDFQQNTVEEAQKLLKKKHGLDISIADIQAALWFHEKELFSKLGVAPERAQPADYADAAKNAMELINKGELYRVKSREKKPAKAYGGAINPIELRYDDLDDTARRLILWSYAAAPIVRPLSRAEGGAVDDPVNKALDIVGAGSPTSAVDTARNLTPMGFYSAAAEAASKIPQRASIDQIVSKITGQPNVKKEELANANLKDAFAGQKSVDPKEVARHLQASIPQISETVYGGKPQKEYKPFGYEGFDDPDFPKADTIYELGPDLKNTWRIPHYQLHKDRHEYNVYDPMGTYHDTFDNLEDATRYVNQSINKMPLTQYGEYTIPGGENYREVVMTLPGEQKYKSSHWPDENPAAHLRMSDRDDGKTLHLEELQSDWGQAGQKIRKQEITRIMKEKGINKNEASKLVPVNFGFKDPNEKKSDSILDQMREEFSFKVPQAPYVTDTGQWVDLGLKRALMEAAKGGYDKLIWTPGEEQASRYSLSQMINHIGVMPSDNEDGHTWWPTTTGGRDLGGITTDKDGNVIKAAREYGDVSGKHISDMFGKNIAEKGMSAKHEIVLAGEDLSIGGEGMKAFYDKLVPQRLNKLVAQYDKDAKVNLFGHDLKTGRNKGFVSGDQIMSSLPETQNMSASEKSDWWRNLSRSKREKLIEDFRSEKLMKVHSIEITPKLRAAILKGLPAFKSGGDVGKSPIIDHAFKVLSKFSR